MKCVATVISGHPIVRSDRAPPPPGADDTDLDSDVESASYFARFHRERCRGEWSRTCHGRHRKGQHR